VEEDAVVASKLKEWLENNLLEGIEVLVSSDQGINGKSVLLKNYKIVALR